MRSKIKNKKELFADILENYDKYDGQYFASKYDVALATVYGIACKLKITHNNRWEKEKENIIEDYNNGASFDFLGDKYGHYESNIRKKLKEWGILIRSQSEANRRYSLNESFFEKIDTHEKAYFLGLLYADGNVNINKKNSKSAVQISLKNEDKYILETLKEKMNFGGKLYNDRNKYTKLIVNSIKICNDVQKLGLEPRKSFTLKFPTENQVPLRFINSFILGVFDGDGCISLCKKNKISFSIISSRGFVEQCSKILQQNLKRPVCIYNDKRHPGISSLVISFGGVTVKDDFIQLYKFLYKNCKYCLSRKREKFEKIINKWTLDAILHEI